MLCLIVYVVVHVPTLMLLLQTHNQAVDPNLVQLAEAYEIAAAQMTPLAVETEALADGQKPL